MNIRKSSQVSFLEDSRLIFLSALSIFWAFQLLMSAIAVLDFFPISFSLEFKNNLLPEYWGQLRPERDLFLYRLFVISAIIIQVSMIKAGSRIPKTYFLKNLKIFIWIELGCCLVLLGAWLIKIFTGQSILFYLSLGSIILGKAAFLQKENLERIQ